MNYSFLWIFFFFPKKIRLSKILKGKYKAEFLLIFQWLYSFPYYKILRFNYDFFILKFRMFCLNCRINIDFK